MLGSIRTGWRFSRGPLGVGMILLIASPFVAHALWRGASFSNPSDGITSQLFQPGAWLSNLAIFGHMLMGGLLTLLAPLQLLGALRRRWPRVHHLIGYNLAVLGVLTALGGLIYIARNGTSGGPVMSLGFALYGLLLGLAAVQTVRLARRRDPRHGIWAGRFIILALASWFFRVQYGLWDIAFGDLGRTPDFQGGFDKVMTFGFYLPWLALYEALRRRTRTRP